MSIFNNFKSKNLKSAVESTKQTKGVFNSKISKTAKIKASVFSKFPKAVIDSQVSAQSKFDSPILDRIAGSRIVSIPLLTDSQADAIREITQPSNSTQGSAVPTPPSPVVPPTIEPTPILESGVDIEPVFSSSTQQSILFLPSLATSEKFFGNILKNLEKPRIVGILENEMTANGIPKESVLFIKRLDTTKYFEERYVILRRATFYENEYYEIGSLSGQEITLDQKYAVVASINFPSYKNLITFVDNNINAHQSYSYKIRVEYRELTDQEKRSKSLLGRAPNLNLTGLLTTQLFNADGEE